MSPETPRNDVLRDQPAPRADHRQAGSCSRTSRLPFAIGHSWTLGPKRLVKAVTDASLQSGVFYASAARTITGPVIDQAEIVPDFRDP